VPLVVFAGLLCTDTVPKTGVIAIPRCSHCFARVAYILCSQS